MVAPLVGIAVAAAARLAAKKLAQKAAKKAVVKAIPKRPTKPIDGVFAPLKRKIVNKNIKDSGGNVKIVPSSPSELRKLANDKATLLATRTKSGKAAKTGAASRKVADGAKPVKIKSGGDIKPATSKKTIASNPANVGRAPSPDRVKWDLETAKLGARKGKTVKINSAPKRTSGNR